MDQNHSNGNSLKPCEYFRRTSDIDFGYEFARDEIRIQSVAEKLLEILETLSPLFQPIVLEVYLNGYNRAYIPSMEKSLRPARAYFQLREKESYPWTNKGEIDPNAETAYAEELSPAAIREWLYQIINSQKDPSPEHMLVLEGLTVRCSRARLIEEERWDGKEAFPLRTRGGSIHMIPLERRKDGLWVSGPTTDSWTRHPALTFDYYLNSDYPGEMECSLGIAWSWWYDPGYAERDCVEQMGKQLVEKGWIFPKDPISSFDFLRKTNE